MLATDIVAFGTRHDEVQAHLRQVMYQISEEACRAAGLPWVICHQEDRGDGLVLIAPACVSAEILIDPLVPHMRAGIRRHNKLASPAAQIRMRMAIHAGYVRLDSHGATGSAVLHLFRLLHADQFKTAVDKVGAEFGLLASAYLYDEIIQHGPGLIDPHTYREITIANKETRGPAWLWLPPVPQPPPSTTPSALPHSR